jgi:hypothetical protein
MVSNIAASTITKRPKVADESQTLESNISGLNDQLDLANEGLLTTRTSDEAE